MNWYNKSKIDQLILSYWGPEPDIKTAGHIWEGIKKFFGGGSGAISNTLYLIAKAPFMAMGIPLGLGVDTLQGGGGSTKESTEEGFRVLEAWKNLFLNVKDVVVGAVESGYGVGEKVVDVAEWIGGQMVEVARKMSSDPKVIGASEQAAEQVKTKLLGFGQHAQGIVA
jgi:hypothetical protein